MTTVSFIPRAGKLEVHLPPLPPLRSSQGLDLTVFKVLSRFPHRVVFIRVDVCHGVYLAIEREKKKNF